MGRKSLSLKETYHQAAGMPPTFFSLRSGESQQKEQLLSAPLQSQDKVDALCLRHRIVASARRS